MASQTINSSHAPVPVLPCVRKSPRLTQMRRHSPEQAHDAEAQQPSSKTADPENLSHCTDERRPNLQAICSEALGIADMIAARPSKVTATHTLNPGNEGGTSREQLRRHVHDRTAQASSLPPNGRHAGALTRRRREKRARFPRANKSGRLRGIPFDRLMPNDEASIRRNEAEGERYYLSRHAGIRFHDEPQDEGRKPDLCNFGRVEEANNRPSHYHCNWVSKKDLCDRGQMGKGMYKGYHVHVHDQVYFADEAGNKMWLVDNEGQAILFQNQKL
ncbi:hypothetical protein VMCG_01792 [Cytospora schulzeri]|uniref:Uncharacterized protein n=1 Tax=Cytospora schulzeri TaxID=448051 RepID=A0A423X2J2_9PEZI|nr:hypothetical protein VMCG_01792 [Valsa malicola]